MSKQEEEQHRQEVEHADETKTKNNKTKLFSHTSVPYYVIVSNHLTCVCVLKRS